VHLSPNVKGIHSMNRRHVTCSLVAGAATLTLGWSALARAQAMPGSGGELTIYCGRNKGLVSELIPKIAAATGLTLDVRYGNTAELAAQILEEGENTPAGLYFCQDAGALGSLARAGRFAPLPENLLGQVEPRYRSPDGVWIGLSGRVRVLLYNPEVTDPATLPAHIIDLPGSDLNGPIAIAPTNAPFQSFVTALRNVYGEDGARGWLQGVIDSGPLIFEDNGPQIQAVSQQEAAVGLVNHYYLFEAKRENPDIAVANYYFPGGDIGGLVNVGGAGVIAGSGQEAEALAVIEYLLGEEAQTYFANETLEYPLAAGVPAVPELPPLDTLEPPDFDLTNLADLEGTLALLTEVGLI
jgi:iron(III) transport system substrate-binding protein